MKKFSIGVMAVLQVACSSTPTQAPSPAPIGPAVRSAEPSSSQNMLPPGCNDPVDEKTLAHSIPTEKLEAFRTVAEQNLTDALVVVKGGHVVLRYQRPGTAARFEAMSVTKSITSVVFGQLVDRGLVHLDDKLSVFYPQWAGDPRGDITVRQVLEHTSGLADEKTTAANYAHGDFIAFALEAKLANPPGTRFFYSNKASNLLSGVVRKVTGQELADFANENFFAKLGISDVTWNPDQAGHTQVMAGAQVTADDLARIGQLIVNDGVWCGQQVVSHDWIETSTRNFANTEVIGPPHGLLWRLKPKTIQAGFDKALFDEWAKKGMPKEFIEKFRPLEGQFFEHHEFFLAILRTLTGKQDSDNVDRDIVEWHKLTWNSGRRDGATRFSGIANIRADGWIGQYLLIYPEEHLVVVRLRHPPEDGVLNDAGSFGDIEKEIEKTNPASHERRVAEPSR